MKNNVTVERKGTQKLIKNNFTKKGQLCELLVKKRIETNKWREGQAW